jgi:hypothetical protein
MVSFRNSRRNRARQNNQKAPLAGAFLEFWNFGILESRATFPS